MAFRQQGTITHADNMLHLQYSELQALSSVDDLVRTTAPVAWERRRTDQAGPQPTADSADHDLCRCRCPVCGQGSGCRGHRQSYSHQQPKRIWYCRSSRRPTTWRREGQGKPFLLSVLLCAAISTWIQAGHAVSCHASSTIMYCISNALLGVVNVCEKCAGEHGECSHAEHFQPRGSAGHTHIHL